MYSPCFSVRHLELRKGGYFGVSASTSPDQYEVCDPSQRSPARPWPSPGAAVAESRPRRGWAFRCATTSTCTRSRCILWTRRSVCPAASPRYSATCSPCAMLRMVRIPRWAAQRSAAVQDLVEAEAQQQRERVDSARPFLQRPMHSVYRCASENRFATKRWQQPCSD